MARSALITGASSGLGAEFAHQLAAQGADLVLIAPDQELLDEVAARLRARFGVDVEVLVVDLRVPRQLDRVVRRLQDQERTIEVLINNAGYGLPLSFERNDIEDEADHLAVHVEAPMRLAHAALGPMLERGHGRIINVASMAAFTPWGTYGAVKAWVVGFSRWANSRYGSRGVTVTAVAPGFVRTRFQERLGLPPGQEGIPGALWLTAPDVVREGLRAAARGRPVSVPSVRYKVLLGVSRLVPMSLLARFGGTRT